MAETIGSRAILDLSNFDANALKYIATMRKMEQASDSQSSGFAKSFGGLPNVLGAARGALSSFGGVLGNIFQIASGIVAANIFGNIASSISRMAGDALAAAANFQTLGIQMQGLIAIQIAEASRGTEDRLGQLGERVVDVATAMKLARGPAAELLDWISDFAVKTPFTVQALSEMVRGFLSMGLGVAPSKALTGAISQLGAGLGLTQPQLNRVAENIIQTGRSMKITERDIREFGNAGLPVNSVLDAMARKLKTTRQGALEFAKSGEEGVAAFRDAIVDVANNDFPDAMDNISKTWNVAASNIKDVIESVFGKEVIGPILGDFAKIVSGGIDSILAKREDFRKLGLQISGMFRLILPEATAFGESISTLTNTVLKLFGIDMSKFDLHTFLIAARLRIEEFLVGATNFTNWINDSLPGIANWGKTFLQALGALDSGKLGEMLGPLASGLTSWITEQSGVLADNIRNNWGPAFVSWLQVDAPVLAEKLGTLLGSVTAWLLTDGLTTLMDAGQDLIGALFGVGSDAAATDAGKNISSAFIDGFSGAMGERKGDILVSVSQVVLDAIGTAQTIATGFTVIGQFAVAQWLLGWNSVVAGISLNVSLGILNAIGAAQAIVGGFVAIGQVVVTNILTGIQGLIANISLNVSQGILNAIAAAQGIVGGFFTLGASIVQGLVSGVLSAAASLAAAVVGVIQDAFAAGQSESDSHSPSRKAAKLLGRPIPLGMEQGILSGLPNVVRATRTVMMAAVSPQNSAGNSYVNANTNTQNSNFNLSVNTRETAQSVTSNFAVMQAMAGV